jgi:glycosyltransferase involved in cell wall biosynthesis
MASAASPSDCEFPGVALAHDYLTQRGGAERLMLAFCRAFPHATLYTSLYDPAATWPEFRDVDVRTLWLNRVAPLRRWHRLALPLLAPAFASAALHAPVTLASSTGWAHGIGTSGRKVVYCNAPARWLYQRERYLGRRRGPARAGIWLAAKPLMRWDQRAARSAHRYLANSTATQRRIRDCYGIEAEVLHPPPTLDPRGGQTVVRALEPGFVLCVSRLLPYKNVEAVVGAAAKLPDRTWVVVGDGPDRARLRGLAPTNVRLLGQVDDAALRWLYANCAALVAPSYEDFGLTPLEAASFGRPVAALRDGGYLDTVREDQTGVFFSRPDSDDVAGAVRDLLARSWDDAAIRAWAGRFSEAAFAARLHSVVREEMQLAAAC